MKLTESDRKSLIRLASSLPKGSKERRILLSNLIKTGRNMKIEEWVGTLKQWRAEDEEAWKAYTDMLRKHGLRGDGALEEAGLGGLARENTGTWDSDLTKAADLGLLKWPMGRKREFYVMMSMIESLGQYGPEPGPAGYANAIKALDSLIR